MIEKCPMEPCMHCEIVAHIRAFLDRNPTYPNPAAIGDITAILASMISQEYESNLEYGTTEVIKVLQTTITRYATENKRSLN